MWLKVRPVEDFVFQLIEISNTLAGLIRNSGTPKEVSALAATLRGYLDSMNTLTQQHDKVEVKQQNNFLILQTLEKDGVLTINDRTRLKYLIDGGDEHVQ